MCKIVLRLESIKCMLSHDHDRHSFNWQAQAELYGCQANVSIASSAADKRIKHLAQSIPAFQRFLNKRSTPAPATGSSSGPSRVV